MMQHTSTPWWRTEKYVDEAPISEYFGGEATGPRGLALVRAWPDGRTDQGWGSEFMEHYNRGEFAERRVLYGYEKGKWNFAVVMRSTALVCIDIDGKNGGELGAKKLGALPLTLAETSKSGDGYHLFYRLAGDSWDDRAGFGGLADRIGIEQGVDVRATGCVYHHPQQRWNRRMPVELPAYLVELLQRHEQKAAATSSRITKILEGEDETEVLLMQDEILSSLNRDIPVGKRNNTLFAIGSEMKTAQIPDWEGRLARRAVQLGLGVDEIDKLVANIEKYAVPAGP